MEAGWLGILIKIAEIRLPDMLPIYNPNNKAKAGYNFRLYVSGRNKTSAMVELKPGSATNTMPIITPARLRSRQTGVPIAPKPTTILFKVFI